MISHRKYVCCLLLLLGMSGLLTAGCGGSGTQESGAEASAALEAARNYPFDRLGVMRQETRLGITAEEGRVISEEAFQMPPAENEIKLRYTYENGESTEAYSFVFAGQGNEEAKAVYPMGVAFRNQGTLCVGHVPALGGDMSYLYHYSACREYRLLTREERESLQGVPMAYIQGYDSRDDSWDLYILTEDGQMVAGIWDGEDYWSDWNSVPTEELYISTEPLPEVVRLHLLAMGMYYQSEEETQ